ncbi:MAG: hypothetical protein KGH78_03435 [Candidatus Micrarchaeota archaeon]|nr:hypothetical protein [Candidatus Micrarchaeota archaeon]
MAKTKLTLTVDREIIKEAKIESLKNDVSISQLVENLLKSLTTSWIDDLMKRLGISDKYISYEDVIRDRSKGFDAGKAVRLMRYGRGKSISGY